MHRVSSVDHTRASESQNRTEKQKNKTNKPKTEKTKRNWLSELNLTPWNLYKVWFYLCAVCFFIFPCGFFLCHLHAIRCRLILLSTEIYGYCTTPTDQSGTCIQLNACGYLYEIVQRRQISSSERSLLQNSQCGYRNGQVLVSSVSGRSSATLNWYLESLNPRERMVQVGVHLEKTDLQV